MSNLALRDKQLKLPSTIRPELNLTKYSDFIFPHPKTKGLDQVRDTSWKKDGVDCSIKISPLINSTTPTSKSYKVLLAIFIHVQLEKIDPTSEIPISLRRIAEILGKSWGGRVAKEICDELSILSATNFTWKQSFNQKGKKNGVMKDFHILNGVEYKAKDIKNGEYFKGVQSIVIEFNKSIAKNIKENYCIPINFDIYQKLKNPYTQIMYLKIGLYLASNKYKSQQLSALKIIDILYIKSIRYFDKAKGKINRKVFLEGIKECLDQQPLTNNYILNIKITETVNRDDYKLIISASKIKVQPVHQLAVVNTNERLVLELCHLVIGALNVSYKSLDANDKSSIKHYCEVYPKNVMEQAMTTYKERSAWKAEQGDPVKNKFAFFATCMHHQAHDSSMHWIKDCGYDCKYKKQVKK